MATAAATTTPGSSVSTAAAAPVLTAFPLATPTGAATIVTPGSSVSVSVAPNLAVAAATTSTPGSSVSLAAALDAPALPLAKSATTTPGSSISIAAASPASAQALAPLELQSQLSARNKMVADAEALQQDFSLLAAQGSPHNRAYLERLSKAAAEAAAKGYGLKRSTHTTRRTRTKKTTMTTDMRTMETEVNTEEKTSIDSWVEEGAPDITGVGVICARKHSITDKYSDGSEEIQSQDVNGKAFFFPNGDKDSVVTHQWSSSKDCSDAASWAQTYPGNCTYRALNAAAETLRITAC